MRHRLASLCLILACSAALAADKGSVERVDREAGGDRFSAGESVNVSTPVAADLMAAGGTVEIGTRVGGDVLAIGGNVRIHGDVDGGVFAGGGQLRLNARVKRSARVAGGQVEIGPKGAIGGNLSVAGGQVRVEGSVFGYVQAASGDVVLDGPVGGDVWVTGGRLALGPNARIAGKLHYASSGELQQDPAAVVKGGIERLDFRAGESHPRREARPARVVGWIWVAGLMVLAAVLVAAAPLFTARASAALRQRPWFAVLIGFIAFVCVPVAALILLVTVIGLPLALVVLLAYPVLLLIGYELTAIGMSDWAMQRVAAERAQSTAWRAVAAAVAVLVIALLTRVPFVGNVVALLALLIGLGVLVLQWRRTAPAA